MTLPVGVLAFLSLVGGYALNGVFFTYLAGVLPAPHAHEGSGIVGAATGSIPGLIGLGLAYALFVLYPAVRDSARKVILPLEKLSQGKCYLDELLSVVVVAPIRGLAVVVSRALDQSIVVASGGALGSVTRAVGELTCRAATGQVSAYVTAIFAGAALLLYVFLPVR